MFSYSYPLSRYNYVSKSPTLEKYEFAGRKSIFAIPYSTKYSTLYDVCLTASIDGRWGASNWTL